MDLETRDNEMKIYTKFGKRHIQAFLCFLALVISFGIKSSLSINILAMTDTDNPNPNIPTYYWTDTVIGTIMSGQFIGYIFSPYIATIMSRRFGPKIPMMTSVTLLTLMTFLLPLFASLSWEWIIVNRALQGVAQGYFLPCILMIMAKWAHPIERGRLIGLTFVGVSCGPTIMIVMSGFIASSSVGWPATFYVTGGFCILWLIVWFLLSRNTPEQHPTISREELEFIRSMPGFEGDLKKRIPFCMILRSKPFWALLLCMCAHNFSFNLLLSFIPAYLDRVLNHTVQMNGLYSALPFFIMMILNIIFSYLSDYLVQREIISIAISRKLFNTIGMWIPGICLIVLGNVPGDFGMVIAIFCLTIGFSSAVYSGFILNFADISPNYAGALIGICHCFGNLMSFIGPIFVGNVVTDFSNAALWNTPFTTAGVVYIVANVIFLIFGRVEVQSWN